MTLGLGVPRIRVGFGDKTCIDKQLISDLILMFDFDESADKGTSMFSSEGGLYKVILKIWGEWLKMTENALNAIFSLK